MKNKHDFVEELKLFYVIEVGNPLGIIDLNYIEEGFNEWVYVDFPEGAQKRICVTADSKAGILNDFVKFTQNPDEYRWLRPDERR